MATKGVYKFFWDCGRMGELYGLFLATDEDVKAAIGKRAYFGEVLGKHSEIEGEVEEADITLVSDDPAVVKVIEDHNLQSGYSPLDYLMDED